MTVASLRLASGSPVSLEVDVLVLGVAKTPDGPRLLHDDPGFASVAAALPSIGAAGAPDELLRLPAVDGGTAGIALVGVGAVKDGVVGTDALRYAAGSAARQLTGVTSIGIALPAADAEAAGAVLEGAAVGAYAYTEYRSGSLAATKLPPSQITVVTLTELDAGAGEVATARAEAVAEAVHTVRDLVAAPPLDLYPETFADRARELAADLPVTIEVLDDAALADGGYGGILGVGQGSTRGPRLVVVRYAPEGATRHLSLVGKGITFDSGGLSLKPAASMVGMKYDMTGAATVLAATLAAARLGLPLRVTARLCIAENLPSGSAIRPNDVLRMRGGATVEVLNTDAEGRLVLADGLVDASAEHPDAIVDVATLTGAARIAMGGRTIPVMGDVELGRRVIAAGEVAGEPFWAMPLPPELRSVLDSEIADIANAKPGNPSGGMLVAAHFLQHFVGATGDGDDARQIPWAHLDIAGAANNTGGGYGFTPKSATGAATRTLIALAESFGQVSRESAGS